MSKAVYAKIAKIVNKELHVDKNGFNDFHKYKYVKEEDILEVLRKAFNDVGLIYTMSVPETKELIVKGEKGESVNTSIMAEFKIIDVDTGESIILKFPGCGQDKGDKGVYKAATGCLKFFLAKNFMISTGNDPENDGQKTKSSGKPVVSMPQVKKPEPLQNQDAVNNLQMRFTIAKSALDKLGREGTEKFFALLNAYGYNKPEEVKDIKTGNRILEDITNECKEIKMLRGKSNAK